MARNNNDYTNELLSRYRRSRANYQPMVQDPNISSQATLGYPRASAAGFVNDMNINLYRRPVDDIKAANVDLQAEQDNNIERFNKTKTLLSTIAVHNKDNPILQDAWEKFKTVGDTIAKTGDWQNYTSDVDNAINAELQNIPLNTAVKANAEYKAKANAIIANKNYTQKDKDLALKNLDATYTGVNKIGDSDFYDYKFNTNNISDDVDLSKLAEDVLKDIKFDSYTETYDLTGSPLENYLENGFTDVKHVDKDKIYLAIRDYLQAHSKVNDYFRSRFEAEQVNRANGKDAVYQDDELDKDTRIEEVARAAAGIGYYNQENTRVQYRFDQNVTAQMEQEKINTKHKAVTKKLKDSFKKDYTVGTSGTDYTTPPEASVGGNTVESINTAISNIVSNKQDAIQSVTDILGKDETGSDTFAGSGVIVDTYIKTIEDAAKEKLANERSNIEAEVNQKFEETYGAPTTSQEVAVRDRWVAQQVEQKYNDYLENSQITTDSGKQVSYGVLKELQEAHIGIVNKEYDLKARTDYLVEKSTLTKPDGSKYNSYDELYNDMVENSLPIVRNQKRLVSLDDDQRFTANVDVAMTTGFNKEEFSIYNSNSYDDEYIKLVNKVNNEHATINNNYNGGDPFIGSSLISAAGDKLEEYAAGTDVYNYVLALNVNKNKQLINIKNGIVTQPISDNELKLLKYRALKQEMNNIVNPIIEKKLKPVLDVTKESTYRGRTTSNPFGLILSSGEPIDNKLTKKINEQVIQGLQNAKVSINGEDADNLTEYSNRDLLFGTTTSTSNKNVENILAKIKDYTSGEHKGDASLLHGISYGDLMSVGFKPKSNIDYMPNPNEDYITGVVHLTKTVKLKDPDTKQEITQELPLTVTVNIAAVDNNGDADGVIYIDTLKPILTSPLYKIQSRLTTIRNNMGGGNKAVEYKAGDDRVKYNPGTDQILIKQNGNYTVYPNNISTYKIINQLY